MKTTQSERKRFNTVTTLIDDLIDELCEYIQNESDAEKMIEFNVGTDNQYEAGIIREALKRKLE